MWNITSVTFAVVHNKTSHFIYTTQEPQLQFAVRDFTTCVFLTSTFLATDWGILHLCYEPVRVFWGLIKPSKPEFFRKKNIWILHQPIIVIYRMDGLDYKGDLF